MNVFNTLLYYTKYSNRIFLSKVETDNKRYLLYPYLFSIKKKKNFNLVRSAFFFFFIFILPNEKTVRFQIFFYISFHMTLIK